MQPELVGQTSAVKLPARLCSTSPRTTTSAPLQRDKFWAYLPSHSNGVAFIMLVSSINAVCYNMVR